MNSNHRLISDRASELWKLNDCPEGRDEEFWLQAENELPKCPVHNITMQFIIGGYENAGGIHNCWKCLEGCHTIFAPRNKEEAGLR